MNNTNPTENVLEFDENELKLPSGLNVLTILTFIGCAFELFSDVRNFTNGSENLAKLEDAQSRLENMPSFARKLAGPEALEIARKGVENRVPILIIALVSIGLCLFGAIEMRRRKKQGYALWLVGELLPVISAFLFIGSLFFQSLFVWFLIFPVVFIILYTSQRKYLIN